MSLSSIKSRPCDFRVGQAVKVYLFSDSTVPMAAIVTDISAGWQSMRFHYMGKVHNADMESTKFNPKRCHLPGYVHNVLPLDEGETGVSVATAYEQHLLDQQKAAEERVAAKAAKVQEWWKSVGAHIWATRSTVAIGGNDVHSITYIGVDGQRYRVLAHFVQAPDFETNPSVYVSASGFRTAQLGDKEVLIVVSKLSTNKPSQEAALYALVNEL